MANENCLKGMKCPACGHERTLKIEILTWMLVFDDGTDVNEDTLWDDHSQCSCPECGHRGKVYEFYEEYQNRRRQSLSGLTLEMKREFIHNFMNQVRDRLLEASNQWPEEWDGMELRGLVKKAIDWEYQGLASAALSGRTKRGKDFNNEWIVKELYR